MSPANLKFARKSLIAPRSQTRAGRAWQVRLAAGFCLLSLLWVCQAACGRDIALYSFSQREIIRVSYAAAPLTSLQTEVDEFDSPSAELIGLKYSLKSPVNPKSINATVAIRSRGESSMVLFHRKLPSRYNYNSFAALQTGYGQLFPASCLGQCRTDGVGPEDLGFFYLKMCLRF